MTANTFTQAFVDSATRHWEKELLGASLYEGEQLRLSINYGTILQNISDEVNALFELILADNRCLKVRIFREGLKDDKVTRQYAGSVGWVCFSDLYPFVKLPEYKKLEENADHRLAIEVSVHQPAEHDATLRARTLSNYLNITQWLSVLSGEKEDFSQIDFHYPDWGLTFDPTTWFAKNNVLGHPNIFIPVVSACRGEHPLKSIKVTSWSGSASQRAWLRDKGAQERFLLREKMEQKLRKAAIGSVNLWKKD